MKIQIFVIPPQETHVRIFIIFIVLENLLFESQIKSTIFNLNN